MEMKDVPRGPVMITQMKTQIQRKWAAFIID